MINYSLFSNPYFTRRVFIYVVYYENENEIEDEDEGHAACTLCAYAVGCTCILHFYICI
jgi:hypothetical protein